MTITDQVIAQYNVKMNGDKAFLAFLDKAEKKAKSIQKILDKFKIPRGAFGGGSGGGVGFGGGGNGSLRGAFSGIAGKGGGALGQAAGAVESLLGQASGSLGIASSVGPIMAVVSAVGMLTGAYVKGIEVEGRWIMEMSKAGGELESMERRIQSVSSSFDASPMTKLMAGREKYQELYQVAKLPGIDMEDASTSYTSLKFNEIGEQLVMRMLKAFGNMNAFTGGGQATFQRVIQDLDKIAAGKDKGLDGIYLRSLSRANIPIYRIMKEQFGVTTANDFNKSGHTPQEFLEKVTEWLETKVPKAADTAKNAWENLDMAIDQAKGKLGEGLNDGGVSSVLGSITKSLDDLSDSGSLQTFGAGIASIASELGDVDFKNAMEQAASRATMLTGALKGVGDGLGTLYRVAMNFVDPTTIGRRIWDKLIGEDEDKGVENMERELALSKEQKAAEKRQRARHGGKTVAEIAEEKRNAAKGLNADGSKIDTEEIMKHVTDAFKPEKQKSKNYEMRRMMMGGDDLARMGVTPVEIGSSARQDKRVTVEVKGAGVFTAVIHDLFSEMLGQLDRQGLLRPTRG